MRFTAGLLILTLALAGCMESQTSVDLGREPAHNECWFFCGGSTEETHVHFDFFPLVLALGLVAGALIIMAVVAGGRDGRQQQQQQVVIQMPEQRR